MHSVAHNKWSGHIYNADDGNTYSSDLQLASAKTLEVRGCMISVLCGGETWTKLADIAIAPPADATVASANQ